MKTISRDQKDKRGCMQRDGSGSILLCSRRDPESRSKDARSKKRTEEATAELRELQYWTEIANTIIKLAQVVGNLTIGGKTGKLIREYTEKR